MIEFLGARLHGARHVVVFTAAGVSAESGTPTFCDALNGLWALFAPAALATANAFRMDPALVWGWYEWRRAMVLAAKPNSAHLAIAELSSPGGSRGSPSLPRMSTICMSVPVVMG